MIRGRLQQLMELPVWVLIWAVGLTMATVCAVPALATEPTGEFAVYKQCPLSNPAVTLCLYGHSTSGEFHIGATTIPINKAIAFQGGISYNEETGTETVVLASNGETLSRIALPVPGGLLGIITPERLPSSLRAILIDNRMTGVTATTEVVGRPGISRSNLLDAEGTAMQLPARIHLNNAFLGGSCYIGSAAHPIVLNMTTGTTSPPPPNTPISGRVGELGFNPTFTQVTVKNNSLVDNVYAVPVAEGCGGYFSFLVDSAIDAKLRLPSASGHNSAILDGSLQLATAEAVKSSEH
jgi:hypothetical protein